MELGQPVVHNRARNSDSKKFDSFQMEGCKIINLRAGSEQCVELPCTI